MNDNQEKLNEQLFNVINNDCDSVETRLKKVKYLVRLGADVNAKLYGKSVLYKAIEKECGKELENFLREKGAVEWVLSLADRERLSKEFWDDIGNLKNVDELEKLIKAGADIERKEHANWTVLMEASAAGNRDVVEMLLRNGAKIDSKNNIERTPLMWAAWYGYADVVEVLLKNGAKIDGKDKGQSTALVLASLRGHKEVIEVLLKNGADVNAKNKLGNNALMHACSRGDKEVVEMLLDKGADVKAKDSFGKTALEIAITRLRCDVVKLLKEHISKKEDDKKNAGKIGGNILKTENEGR